VHIPAVQRAPLAVQKVTPPPPGAGGSPPSGAVAGASTAAAAPQQIWFNPPHGDPTALVQDPAVQVPEMLAPLQVWPAPTQVLTVGPPSVARGIQHPPPLQLLPPQQGSLAAPHARGARSFMLGVSPAVPSFPVPPPASPLLLLPPPHPSVRAMRAALTIAGAVLP
jgi:hypothetical protein